MGNRICCGRWRGGLVEERLTRPQRLSRQPSNLDYKKLRRLIRAEKLAPCFDAEDEPRLDLEECPICFLYFPSLNRSRCCAKGICTECFLQMKPSGTQDSTQCPFCKTSSYAVEYRGARSDEEKALEQVEEQKVIEAKIRMQYQDSQCVDIHMLVDNPCSILKVHLPKKCFQGICDVPRGEFDLPLEGNANGDADDSLPSSSTNTGRDRSFAACEDSLVLEAIWQSLKDPRVWSTSGMLHLSNQDMGVCIHVKEDYTNSRIVISKDLLEQLGAKPAESPNQSLVVQDVA